MPFEEQLIELLVSIPSWFATIILSALPISELRGSIPIAIGVYGLGPIEAYFLAVLGNLIPVIPLLLSETVQSRGCVLHMAFHKDTSKAF